MRRMYTEQQLTAIIREVFEAELASGALDDKVSAAVDAYLVEHPVDITALEGQDISPEDISATGAITAPSIIETMAGYSFTKKTSEYFTFDWQYAGIVKQGNILHLAVFVGITLTAEAGARTVQIGEFNVPSAVTDKIVNDPTLYACTVASGDAFSSTASGSSIYWYIVSESGKLKVYANIPAGFSANVRRLARIECAFLLDENLASE